MTTAWPEQTLNNNNAITCNPENWVFISFSENVLIFTEAVLLEMRDTCQVLLVSPIHRRAWLGCVWTELSSSE